MNTKKVGALAAAACLFCTPMSVLAATIHSLAFDACDGPFPNAQGPAQPDTRDFIVTLDGAATCVAAGMGNIQGSQSEADNYLGGSWLYIEKNEGGDTGWIDMVSGLNSNTGVITLHDGIWSTFSQLAIGFKSGEGKYDPDWVIFTITGGDLTINYTILPVQAGGLSHVNLYGVPAEVPIPGTLGLLGLGLAGLGSMRRKASA